MPVFSGPIPGLPTARAYLRGPSRRVLLKLIRRGDLVWPPDDELDERVTEQLRPNLAAQWADPRERLRRD